MRPPARRLSATLGAVLACATLLGGGGAQASTITLDVGAWPPHIDFSAPDGGSLTAIVRAAFALSEVETRLVEVSWKTAEVRLDAGEAVSFGWIRNAERLRRWTYSEPICIDLNILVTRIDRPVSMDNPDHLSAQRIGWSRGYSYGDAFDSMRSRLNVREMPSDEVALRHLLNGTIDAMPMAYTVARHLAAEKLAPQDARRLRITDESAQTIHSAPLHLVCKREAAACGELVNMFNRGLKALRGNAPPPTCGGPEHGRQAP